MDSAERIVKELLHEQASLWYISDQYGSKVMIKTTSVSIKSIMQGCKVEFLFGKDKKQRPTIFHTGIRIYDDPVHYLLITGTQRFKDEHFSLEKIMNLSKVFIHFHNELNVCVATAVLSFDVKDQLKVLNLLGNINDLFTGNFDSVASQSLDCFGYSLKIAEKTQDVYEIETLSIEGHVSDWIVMENHFIGQNEKNKTLVNDSKEGDVLEKQIWVSLESLFGSQLFRNPKIPNGKNSTRELTDILAFSDYGIFLIESKAMNIPESEMSRTMDRKVIGLQKQIDKAIKQLMGAVRMIKSRSPIFDNVGKEIAFNKELIPHCIVLVSELLPFGDWAETERKMMQAMVDNRVYLNVLDLREFMQYVGISRESKNKFDYFLMDRANQFVEHETIHLSIKEVFSDSR
jgi:hypothetical protein